jgi:hypothetical protein
VGFTSVGGVNDLREAASCAGIYTQYGLEQEVSRSKRRKRRLMKKHRRYLAVSATVTSVNSLRDQYPTLSGLFACYLHQDWTDEFPDAETALAEGIASMSPGERAQAGEDMDRYAPTTPRPMTVTHGLAGSRKYGGWLSSGRVHSL